MSNPYIFLALCRCICTTVGLSYDETDYGRSSWFVDLFDTAKEKRPERSISSGHLVTLDEPDLSNWPADDSNQSQIPLGMHNATFETRFGGLSMNELSIDMPPNKRSVFKCIYGIICTSVFFCMCRVKVAVTAKLLIDTWIYKIHKTQNKECTKLYAVSSFSTTITLLP